MTPMSLVSDPPSTSSSQPGPDGGPPTAKRADGLLVIVGVLAAAALVVSVLAIAFGQRAINESGNGTTASTAAIPSVTLTELKISPSEITTGISQGLEVKNGGTVQHNIKIQDAEAATPMIAPGQSAHLDTSSLKAGDYTIYCEVPGHKDGGMIGTLHLTTAAVSSGTMAGMDMSGGSSSTPTTMTQAAMDKAMTASIGAFPAKTEGLGAQVLAPTILPDGTKQWELTAKIVDWEVSPGKKVKAWTYNGTVPGPTLEANDGDKISIVLHNELPMSTSIHFHGLQTPNAMDGTTVVTQDPVLPGASFTYAFVAHGPAVGMYHSHHDAVDQVPNGLAGAILIGQEPTPAGVTVAQRSVMILDDSGVISYALNGKSFPATAPYVAKQGDWIEVNYMNEGTQIHPMHLHGMPQLVIAKDGWPVSNPSNEDTVTVAPGERKTVLIHATELGTWVWHCHILPHAENNSGMFGMVTALIVK